MKTLERVFIVRATKLFFAEDGPEMQLLRACDPTILNVGQSFMKKITVKMKPDATQKQIDAVPDKLREALKFGGFVDIELFEIIKKK